MVTKLDEDTEEVIENTKGANVELTKGIASARRARKLKWILFGICTFLLVSFVVVMVVYFKVIKPWLEAEARKRASGL
jgi:syntaxin 1B/2/3